MTKGTRINIWAEIQNENLFSILNWGSYSIWVGWHEVCEAYEWHGAQVLECNEDKYMTESHLSKYRTKILLAIKGKSKYSIYSFEGISNLETVRFLFYYSYFMNKQYKFYIHEWRYSCCMFIYIVVCFWTLYNVNIARYYLIDHI